MEDRPEETKMSRSINCLDANIPNNEGLTPLALAAGRSMSDMVQLLLTSDKVDPNAKNGEGRTALTIAIAIRGEYKISHWLRYSSLDSFIDASKALCTSSRVDLNAKDDLGHTPLYYAVQRFGVEPRMFEVVNLLLRSDTVDTEPGLVNIEAASEEVREVVEKAHRMRQARSQKATEASTVRSGMAFGSTI